MDSSFSMGGLIPLWILGAPLLAAVFMLVTTPERSSRSDPRDTRDPRAPQPLRQPVPASGTSAERRI
jgi:hypothetical protein